MIAFYFNGRCFDGDKMDECRLSIADRGFLIGDGLFETLPVFNSRPLWWPEHRKRLKSAAETIGLQLNFTEIDDAVNSLTERAHERAVLRITVTRGTGGRGLLPPDGAAPVVLATLSALPSGMAFAPANLILSTMRRNEHSPSSTIKSINYLDNILATRDASQKGADDALFLNTAGNAACTTICNLFAIIEGRIITPPVSQGVLPGIMREKLLALGNDWEYEICEAPLPLAELKKADGLFLTNSLRFIRRVSRLDEKIYDPPTGRDAISNLQDHVGNLIQAETGIFVD